MIAVPADGMMKGMLEEPVRRRVLGFEDEAGGVSEGEVTFRWVRDGVEFAALEPVWDTLLERCETVSPFMRWDWVWRWWVANADLFEPAICVAEEAGEVVAMAPFAIGKEEKGSRRGLKQLGLMAGLGEAQGERINVMIPAERVEELAPALLGRLADLTGQWDAVRWNRIPAESAILHHLMCALREITANSGVLNTTSCRFLRMEQETWEAFETSRSRNWRRNQKRLRKELEDAFGVTYHTGTIAPNGEDVVEALLRLHAKQFEGEESFFTSDRALVLHRELIPLWEAQGKSQMCYLMAGGKVISVVQVLHEGQVSYAFQVGRDLAYGETSVGSATFGWAVECAFRSGARSLDFLAGDFEYKRRWTAETRTVLDLEGYAPWSWRARVFLLLRWLRRKTMKPKVQAGKVEAGESGESDAVG
jgi:CelD/BcsL family acetyltransferase involved in cellulose biosynthesis